MSCRWRSTNLKGWRVRPNQAQHPHHEPGFQFIMSPPTPPWRLFSLCSYVLSLFLSKFAAVFILVLFPVLDTMETSFWWIMYTAWRVISYLILVYCLEELYHLEELLVLEASAVETKGRLAQWFEIRRSKLGLFHPCFLYFTRIFESVIHMRHFLLCMHMLIYILIYF